MNTFLAILCLAILPVCSALNCYYCASGMTGCNDPFNATASNVTTVSSTTNTYCVKTMLTSSIVSRYGSASCTNTPFIYGVGMACCQTDLCNGAQVIYQVPILINLSFFIILFKFY